MSNISIHYKKKSVEVSLDNRLDIIIFVTVNNRWWKMMKRCSVNFLVILLKQIKNHRIESDPNKKSWFRRFRKPCKSEAICIAVAFFLMATETSWLLIPDDSIYNHNMTTSYQVFHPAHQNPDSSTWDTFLHFPRESPQRSRQMTVCVEQLIPFQKPNSEYLTQVLP